MRIYPGISARTNAYDRNAIPRASAYFTSAIAPHALTVRWSYTVPASKKFQLGGASVGMANQTATTAGGIIESSIRYTPSGGAATRILSCIAGVMPNANNLNVTGLQGAFGFAGDLFEGITQDTSVTTTNLYQNEMQGIEFDA